MRRVVLIVAVVGMVAITGCVDELEEATSGESGGIEGGEIPDGEFQLHHIDVGQADATLLLAPNGESMLIDTGDWRDSGETVLAYLDKHDIDHIDHLVGTHGHADHIGGHADIIETYETERDGIGAIYDSGVAHTSQTYENYLDAVERHGVDLFEVAAGDELPFGDDVDVTVMNPPEGDSGTDLHYNSIVLGIEFGEVQYLTTGDAETNAESRLSEEWGSDLGSDIYHAGHHGSKTSSSESFLAEVSPSMGVISSGYDSQFGHPDDAVLERFDEFGVETYWTGVHGDIVMSTDGETVSVSTEHDESTDPATILELKPDDETNALGAIPGDPPSGSLHP